MNRLQILATVCCAALASCTSFQRTFFSDNTNRGVELADTTTEDGTRQVWRAYPGDDTNPRLEKTSTKTDIVPDVGMTVSAVNRERAESIGVTPWRGVWVDQVDEGKPADRAGIVRGDIVLQIDGQDVASAEQFADLAVNRGVPDQPLQFTLRVKRKPGEAIDSEHSSTVSVTPVGAQVRTSTTDSIPLEESKGVQMYTGLQVASVEPELARSIYGTNQPITLVTGVVTGSPAYYAGLRAGDRVVRVDGQTVESIQDVRNAVLARIHSTHPTAPTYDLAVARSTPIADGARSDDVQFEVDGPLGAHHTPLSVSDSVDHRSRFYIPILVDYESRVNRSEFGFLNFIFQFGFNYDSRVRPSSTRAPIETSRLSILPLGMFEIHHGESRSDYTLFWFIHFGSDH